MINKVFRKEIFHKILTFKKYSFLNMYEFKNYHKYFKFKHHALFPRPCFSQTMYIKFASRRKKLHQKELFNLVRLAAAQKWKLTGAVLFLFVSSTVTMSVPFCVGKLIDIINNKSKDELKENLRYICKFFIVIFVIGAISNFGRIYLLNIASQHIVNNLRTKVYASVLSQELAFFDSSRTGELINRLSADTTTVGISITNNVSDGLRYLFMFIGGSSLMVYTSPWLACLGLLTVTPVAVVGAISGKILKRNSKAVQDALAEATQVAEERISNIRTVQAFAKLEEENLVYGSKISSVLHFAKKEAFGRAIFFGMTGFSGNMIILTVMYYGGFMLNDNMISIGGMSSFVLYAAYVGISIGGISTFYTELMRGLGASTRIWELIHREPLISFSGGKSLPQINGCVDFNSVSFTYPSRPDAKVLCNFNLSIPAGSFYALVGPSGCGKSTVGSLLLRLYDCQSGSVSIDGHNIKSLNVQWLRKNIGTVSQEPILFSSTIRENILYGVQSLKNISNDDIEQVLIKANALEFVKKFKNNLDTVVGERGVMLSGGQRQRLAIARALLKNPRILILDEATSALDAESEGLVHDALSNLMHGRTVLTIAHRLSTIRNADVIIVIDNGKVVEQGKYELLLSNKGLFHRLVQLQSLRS